jgi:hypothetical protein
MACASVSIGRSCCTSFASMVTSLARMICRVVTTACTL